MFSKPYACSRPSGPLKALFLSSRHSSLGLFSRLRTKLVLTKADKKLTLRNEYLFQIHRKIGIGFSKLSSSFSRCSWSWRSSCTKRAKPPSRPSTSTEWETWPSRKRRRKRRPTTRPWSWPNLGRKIEHSLKWHAAKWQLLKSFLVVVLQKSVLSWTFCLFWKWGDGTRGTSSSSGFSSSPCSSSASSWSITPWVEKILIRYFCQLRFKPDQLSSQLNQHVKLMRE